MLSRAVGAARERGRGLRRGPDLRAAGEHARRPGELRRGRRRRGAARPRVRRRARLRGAARAMLRLRRRGAVGERGQALRQLPHRGVHRGHLRVPRPRRGTRRRPRTDPEDAHVDDLRLRAPERPTRSFLPSFSRARTRTGAIYHGYGGRIASRNHAPGGFALPPGLKDVSLVRDAAANADVPMPLGSLLVWLPGPQSLARGATPTERRVSRAARPSPRLLDRDRNETRA